MKSFILTNVVPDLAAYVFGKAFLWLPFSPVFEKFCIPIECMGRIKLLLKELQENEEGGDDMNPIVQVPVLVTGGEGTKR
jgi:hypothetical protein